MSRTRSTSETDVFPPQNKSFEGKKSQRRERNRGEKGEPISQEGFREHPRLFVEHAIKQEADKRHPATKELMQSRHFKQAQRLAFRADISNKGC